MSQPLLFLQAIAYAPLLPIAAAATVGLVADRYLIVPIPFSLGATLLCLIAWVICRRRQRELLSYLYLWAAWAGLAAGYHHAARHLYPANEIGAFAKEEPAIFRLRGMLVEEPIVRHYRKDDPLVSLPRIEPTVAVVEVTEIEQAGGWVPSSGKVQMRVEGKLDGLHLGDEIEAAGWLSKPSPPLNPGESSYGERLLDRRIRAEFHVRKSADPVVRLKEGWSSSFFGWLAVLRGWGQRALQEALPPSVSGIAAALLLGDGSAMTSEDWEKYIRTGVIHVLAISGQHLVVLGAFLWFLFRLMGMRNRRAAFFVAGFMLAYALLTGGRPSAMRAAVMVGIFCAGIIFRRPALPANTFAFAWLVVLALNPTDLFTAGFQLSFLCVAVLIWGMPRWFPHREPTPLEQLIDESRAPWVRAVRGFIRVIGQ
ncbi:MAG: ComEC family competence protein, partial [Planctomycetes bacterium]|nr:ComEC family competence protein [Planctomycetota bacterium]